jgi:hypothetical protein
MKYFLTALFFFTSIASNCQQEDGILINPATIDFNLNNGQSKTQQIVVTNKMPQKMQFTIYINDWTRDTIGQHQYLEPGTLSRSCARWIALDKKFLDLEPNATQIINVKLSVPDSVQYNDQMRWAMVFIEQVNENKPVTAEKGKVTTSATTVMRVGVHIYQTPALVLNKEIRIISFKPMPGNESYRIVCQNTGEMQVRCKSYIELTSTVTGKKYTVNGKEVPLFPEQKRYLDFALPKELPKGVYKIFGALDGGEDIPLEAATSTWEKK